MGLPTVTVGCEKHTAESIGFRFVQVTTPRPLDTDTRVFLLCYVWIHCITVFLVLQYLFTKTLKILKKTRLQDNRFDYKEHNFM